MESVPPTKCQKQMRNPLSATTTFNPLTGSQLNGDPGLSIIWLIHKRELYAYHLVTTSIYFHWESVMHCSMQKKKWIYYRYESYFHYLYIFSGFRFLPPELIKTLVIKDT